MKAEVKSIFSSDINFEKYYPEHEDSFMFLIQVTVGVKGTEGGDLFDIEVSKILARMYSG